MVIFEDMIHNPSAHNSGKIKTLIRGKFASHSNKAPTLQLSKKEPRRW
jgi:hypothetical protein